MFILAGLAIINGYAVAGGTQPNGALSPGAPFLARVVQYLLGVAIAGLMFANEPHPRVRIALPSVPIGHHTRHPKEALADGSRHFSDDGRCEALAFPVETHPPSASPLDMNSK
jgi:hypothetical protein